MRKTPRWLNIWESSLPGVLQTWLGKPGPIEEHSEQRGYEAGTGSQADLSCVRVAHPVSSCPASRGGAIEAVYSVSFLSLTLLSSRSSK